MKKETKQIILFFTTAGIGNIICILLTINKKRKNLRNNKKTIDSKFNEINQQTDFYYNSYQENLALAKKYEKEYNFDKALLHCRLADNSIMKIIELNAKIGIDMEYLTPPRMYESQLLVKMNRLDEAIKVLNTSKNISIYKYDTIFKDTIDKTLEDLQKKKENGYIYKPRNRH